MHLQNMRKGLFARSKVAGKRVLELGSGMGLGGIAMSLMGANVTFTGKCCVVCVQRVVCVSVTFTVEHAVLCCVYREGEQTCIWAHFLSHELTQEWVMQSCMEKIHYFLWTAGTAA